MRNISTKHLHVDERKQAATVRRATVKVKGVLSPKLARLGPVNDARYKDELNAEQYKAAATASGRLLVLAGAGTGKTRAITYRAARLLESGVAPGNIVMVTFTKKAATEMERRIERIGYDAGVSTDGMLIGTFHALCFKMLLKFGSAVGVKGSTTIYDSTDSADAIRWAYGVTGIEKRNTELPTPGLVYSLYSISRNNYLDFSNVYLTAMDGSPYTRLLGDMLKVIECYGDIKRDNNALDFDDLLFFTKDLFDTPIGKKLSACFHYVMVDEYQDTNRVQDEMVNSMSAVHGNLCVVGDTAQGIYGFRGATIGNIIEFGEQPDTQIVKLEKNYRSTQAILDVANTVVRHSSFKDYTQLVSPTPASQYDVLPTVTSVQLREHQYTEVLDQITMRINEGSPPSEIAVLSRGAYALRDMEAQLIRAKIKYDLRGGTGFLERKHVKDVLALAKVACNPSDMISLKRVLSLIAGVGHVTSHNLAAEVRRKGVKALFSFKFRNNVAVDHIKNIGKFLTDYTPTLTASRSINSIARVLVPVLTDNISAPAKKSKLSDLKILHNMSKHYRTLSKMLTDISLNDPVNKDDDDRLVLSTVHSAKGLEWDHVFIINCVEGAMPIIRDTTTEKDIAEERNVFYVAVTRARQTLTMTLPRQKANQQGGGFAATSRFIRELYSDNIPIDCVVIEDRW